MSRRNRQRHCFPRTSESEYQPTSPKNRGTNEDMVWGLRTPDYGPRAKVNEGMHMLWTWTGPTRPTSSRGPCFSTGAIEFVQDYLVESQWHRKSLQESV